MDLGAAAIAVFMALAVKGAVMAFGAWLLVRVYRLAYVAPAKKLWLLLPAEDLPEVKLLWWSLVLFYAAELTCGVEVYVIFRSSALMSAAHAFTSASGMGLFALGLWRFLDRKLFRFGETGCIANRICRGCTLGAEEGCKFRATLLFLATFVALAAVAPFFAPAERMVADTSRYALPVPSLNAWYDRAAVPWLEAHFPGYERSGAAYYLPSSMLLIEWRILPGVAMALAVTAIGLLRRGREAAGVRCLAFAAGVLSYSYFELVLYRVTGDVILGGLGHEVVELWFLAAAAELLRRCFGPRRAAVPGDGAKVEAVA